MPRFSCSTAIRDPDDVVPFLPEGERHWRKGYSAYELAHSGVGAGSIRKPVRDVLDTAPEYRGAEVIEGIFERETDLRTRGRPSQTDLLALVSLPDGSRAFVGVEGKVEEPFGQRVHEWRDGSAGKERRLAGLCETLDLDPKAAGDLRYQLLHRTAAAIYEAQGFGWGRAMMPVQSFSGARTSLADFLGFASAMGAPVHGAGEVSASVTSDGIALRLAWVADQPSA